MGEPSVGRVLVASLHQAISDVLPTRLSFYESWLNAEGLREGTIGLAPLYAVLSFLRQEGETYSVITSRAGEYAADWTVASMPPLKRTMIGAAPEWLRARMLLRVGGTLVRGSYHGSRVTSTMKRRSARIVVRASVFCTVREPVDHPLCGYYAAAFTRLLLAFNLPGQAVVSACRGTGEPTCVLTIALPEQVRSPEREVEAA